MGKWTRGVRESLESCYGCRGQGPHRGGYSPCYPLLLLPSPFLIGGRCSGAGMLNSKTVHLAGALLSCSLCCFFPVLAPSYFGGYREGKGGECIPSRGSATLFPSSACYPLSIGVAGGRVYLAGALCCPPFGPVHCLCLLFCTEFLEFGRA